MDGKAFAEALLSPIHLIGRPQYLADHIGDAGAKLRLVLLLAIPLWAFTIWAHQTHALSTYLATAQLLSDDAEGMARIVATFPLTLAILTAAVFVTRAHKTHSIKREKQLILIGSVGALTAEGLQVMLSQGAPGHMPSFALISFIVFAISPLTIAQQLGLLITFYAVPALLSLIIGPADLAFKLSLPLGAALTGAAIYHQAYANFRKRRLVELRLQRRTALAESQRVELEAQRAAQVSRIKWLESLASFLRHEMKNALVGAKTSLTLLQRRSNILEDDKYFLRTTKALRIIDELLENASRATSLEMAIRREEAELCNLSDLVDAQVDEYRHIYPGVRFDRSIGDPKIVVKSNEDHLVQLLDKLVSNAVDYHAEGTAIKLTVQSAENKALLSVENQGPPLPEDKNAIFDLFFSSRPSDKNDLTRGFGLHVVKVIAESYGGGVAAYDLNPSSGARFVVTLPLVN